MERISARIRVSSDRRLRFSIEAFDGAAFGVTRAREEEEVEREDEDEEREEDEGARCTPLSRLLDEEKV